MNSWPSQFKNAADLKVGERFYLHDELFETVENIGGLNVTVRNLDIGALTMIERYQVVMPE